MSRVVVSEYMTRFSIVSVFNHPNATATSAPVDLSPALQVGDVYELRDPYDLWGAPVLCGTYQGGAVTLPISGKVCGYVLVNKRITVEGETVNR